MKYLSLSFLVLLGLNALVWQGVWERYREQPLAISFLDVGQGDSSLVVLPGGVKVLIDGGPDKKVLFELDEVLGKTDKYIDLLVVSHAQLDHFGGLHDVVERYVVGAVVYNGREGGGEAWQQFRQTLDDQGVPLIVLGEGDRLVYGESVFTVFSPGEELLGMRDLNEASLVMELESEGVEILFTGDIGFAAERLLLEKYDMNTDILKVAHHGSRYSTGQNFLEGATPALAVISVGSNRFGHPTEAVLERIRRLGSLLYRTDQDGRVKIVGREGKVGVVVEDSLY